MIRWTPDKQELLRTRWAEGATMKAICFELGCGTTSLKRQQKKLGLPSRRPRWEGGKGHRICAYVPDAEFAMVCRGAARLRATNSQYLRSLIRRDASTAGGSVVVTRGGEGRVVL